MGANGLKLNGSMSFTRAYPGVGITLPNLQTNSVSAQAGVSYTISNAGIATVANIGTNTSTISLTGNGFTGAFSTPNPTANAAAGLALALSDIALPGTINNFVPAASTSASSSGSSVANSVTNSTTTLGQNESQQNGESTGPAASTDASEGRSVTSLADLGRNGANGSNVDLFSQRFELVSPKGSLSDQDYFAKGLFDYIAGRRRDNDQ